MENGLIFWTHFSWEAFATLTTGLAAVGAAWHIGLRQVAIQKAQANIQTQELRGSLFARRLENYETVRDLVSAVLRTPREIDPHLQQRFFTAQREAQFLFSAKVVKGLDDIWDLCGQLNAQSSEIALLYAVERHAGVNLPQAKHATYLALSEKFRNLAGLYEEMGLKDLQAVG